MQDEHTPTSTPSREGIPSREEIRETAEQVADSARQEYDALRSEALHEARSAVDTVKRSAHDYTDAQRTAAADNVDAIAHAMQASVDSLESQGQHLVARYWQRVADETHDLAGWLRGRSLDELWQETEGYARQRPAVVFGGALAAGFLLARVLRSSPPAANPSPNQTKPMN